MAQKLDFSGRVQLYYQLYDILYNDIKSGLYQPGELLPTENELIETYGISRVTVRKAMDLLMNDGLILKRRGYGTYVQQPKMALELNKANYFARLTEKFGYIAHTEVLANKKTTASKTVAVGLGIAESAPVVNLKRIRYANDIPVRYESAYFDYQKYPLIEKHDFNGENDGSLKSFLQYNYNVAWSHLTQKIYAIAADTVRARYLKVPEGTPILYSECLFFTADNAPQEVTHVYYRGDSNFFTFATDLSYTNP